MSSHAQDPLADPELLPNQSSQVNPRKRNLLDEDEETDESKKKKKKVDLKEKLRFNDNEKRTCIHKYVDYYEKDALVKEFVEKLCRNRILPIPPDPDLVEEWIDFPKKCGLTAVTKAQCISDFGFYFQSRYSMHQISEAIKHKIAIFNPRVNLNVSQFQLFPLLSLENCGDLKEDFALQYMAEINEGSEFATQLCLLRILDRIYDEIKILTEEDDHEKTILYHYGTLYTKSRTAFFKKYNVKKIEWLERKSKVVVSKPFWRKQIDRKPPPENRTNKYLASLCDDVLKGKVDFDGASAKKEFNDWLNKDDNNLNDTTRINNNSQTPIRQNHLQPNFPTRFSHQQIGLNQTRFNHPQQNYNYNIRPAMNFHPRQQRNVKYASRKNNNNFKQNSNNNPNYMSNNNNFSSRGPHASTSTPTAHSSTTPQTSISSKKDIAGNVF